MKSNYLHLLSDRDHLLMHTKIYHDEQVGKEEEVNRLNYELEISQGSSKSAHMALQESKF